MTANANAKKEPSVSTSAVNGSGKGEDAGRGRVPSGQDRRVWRAGLLVVLAGFSIHLYYWFHRKPEKLVHLLAGDGLRPPDWRSFARNGLGFTLGALAFWLALGWWVARKREQPLRAVLRNSTKAFLPCLAFAPFSLIHYWQPLENTVSFVVRAVLTSLVLVAVLRTYDADVWRPLDGRTRMRQAGVWALIVGGIFFLDLTACSLYRFYEFRTHIDDLGLYDQMCWGLLHGYGFLTTIYALPHDTFLAEHIVPTLAVVAQLYRIWSDPRLLLLLQSAALIGSGWLVYRIARQRTEAKFFPLALAFSYFINPLLERGWINDFHPDALEVFLFLGAYAALLARAQRKALVLYWVAIVLLLGCKEDAGLSVAAFGVVIAIAHRRWALGAATATAGLAWSLAAILLLLPHFASVDGQPAEPNRQIANYVHLVTDDPDFDPADISAADIALAPVRHPVQVVKAMLYPPRVVSVLKILLPVACLPLLAPLWLLLLGPPYLTTILSGWEGQYALHTHYGLVFLAPTYIAAIEGWRRLETWLAQKPQALGWCAAVLVCLAILSSNQFRKFPIDRPLKWRQEFRTRVERHEVLEAGKAIEPAASLCVDEALGSHFSQRRYVYKFPHCPEGTEFVLLYLNKPNPMGPGQRGDFNDLVTHWIQERAYGIRRLEGDALLLEEAYTEGNQAALLGKVQSKILR